MDAIVVILVIALVAAAIGAGLWLTRRARRTPDRAAAPTRTVRPEPPPMRGLEDALNQVTDSSGTTMAARLDAEGAHVDDLRDVDDTGPLLRRALDHVTPRHQAGEPGAPEAATATNDVHDPGAPLAPPVPERPTEPVVDERDTPGA